MNKLFSRFTHHVLRFLCFALSFNMSPQFIRRWDLLMSIQQCAQKGVAQEKLVD